MNTLNAPGWRQEINTLQSYTQTSAYALLLVYWLRAALQPVRAAWPPCGRGCPLRFRGGARLAFSGVLGYGSLTSMWLFIGLSTVGTLFVLFLLSRRSESDVQRDWDLLRSPKGEKLYRSIETRMQSELDLADIAYGQALAGRELGSMDEAIRLVDAGYKIIERFAPSMMRLLAAMATFSRMVSAIAPVRPLRPRDFKLAQLASLAALNRIIHQFLVTAKERFRLKLYVLGRGFGLATRYLLQSTERIVNRTPQADKEWEQIDAIRKDFQTLTDESMDSLRVLLTSLASEPPVEINASESDCADKESDSQHRRTGTDG